MIVWFILGIGLAAFLLLLLSWWANAEVATAKRGLFWLIVGVCALIGVGLLLRGNGLMAVLPFAFAGWRMFAANAAKGRGTSGPHSASAKTGPMTPKEAREILGLKRDASAEDIRAAYRAAMAKYHPDKGGNDWMASKINEAKRTLLDD